MSDLSVIERVAAAPEVDELRRATTTTVGDLLRFAAPFVRQATNGTFGDGENACALSAAGIGWEALRQK